MDNLNYNHLRYFWAIARHGNLTRAARELHLTPQTISAQLRLLEDNLGEELFFRQGRRLILSEAGETTLKYAEEIFALGKEMMQELASRPSVGRSRRLVIGIADVLPKLVAERLISPALDLPGRMRITCREASADVLLGELAIHQLDVVLSDEPIPSNLKIRAFNHLLGECGVLFMVAEARYQEFQKNFPLSLDGAPLLLPTQDTALRHSLDHWLSTLRLHPKIVGEFQDSALMKVFGQAGKGIFAVPAIIEEEVKRQHRAATLGTAEGIVERFYAISTEKRIRHRAVAAICNSARTDLFA